ncbi:hypothetical protein EOK75_01610 [Pseudorhodobacter turbinis]|uniref:Exonuclease domain-containing protein n=1 Tax=Pseudorhodobacter turbinis TaxID=2500533 RepID=A0A4P8ED22_9RHOB|nr:hypothetical protein EOK75_01610 [Pseudorhodobacter turbinis]
MTKPNIEKFATLDFEASSLSQESWPIEVGLSWLADGEVQTWSTLIRPTPGRSPRATTDASAKSSVGRFSPFADAGARRRP